MLGIDCKCGGANHGTGKVVQTVVAEGRIKAVGLTEEDIERANVFRKLRDYAYGLVKDYVRVRELDKIVALKVYKARNERLIKFITENKSV